MWPLSTEPGPGNLADTTSARFTARPGVVGCRFRPQGASAVGVHKASLTPPSDDVSRPKELFDGGYVVSGLSEQKEPVLSHKHHTLNHTNWAAAHSSRRRGWRRRASTAGAKSVATPPREFLLMTAGETGSKRSKFRARKRACTPVGSLGMEG